MLLKLACTSNKHDAIKTSNCCYYTRIQCSDSLNLLALFDQCDAKLNVLLLLAYFSSMFTLCLNFAQEQKIACRDKKTARSVALGVNIDKFFFQRGQQNEVKLHEISICKMSQIMPNFQ